MSNHEKLKAFLRPYERSFYDGALQLYALPFSFVPEVAKFAKQLYIPILGGDVYIIQNGSLIPAYANWYITDKKENESDIEYLERSVTHTEQYLADLPKDFAGDEYVFDIVFGDSLT